MNATPVIAQEVIAGVGVAEREVELPGGPVEEAIDDLRVAVADWIGLAPDRGEVDAVHPFADEDAPAAELHVDRRDGDERMPAPEAGEDPMTRGLELVVALRRDPLAELREHRLDIEPGHQPAKERGEHAHVAHVRLDRLADAGVLDLHRDLEPIGGSPAVDLPNARRGRRLGVDLLEHPLGILPPFVSEHLAHLLPAHGGHVLAE